jgi:hypothetical protein
MVAAVRLTQFARERAAEEIYCGVGEQLGFVPPTDDEFRRLATEMKPILDPKCAVCVEVDGRFACAVACRTSTRRCGTDGRLFPLGLIRLLGPQAHHRSCG